MSKLFENLKEPQRKTEGKDFRLEIAQDFERLKTESKAYFFFMKRISEMRDVAHYHVMLTAGEPIGIQWRVKLQLLDEILGVPDEFMAKAHEAQEEEHLTSVV